MIHQILDCAGEARVATVTTVDELMDKPHLPNDVLDRDSMRNGNPNTKYASV